MGNKKESDMRKLLPIILALSLGGAITFAAIPSKRNLKRAIRQERAELSRLNTKIDLMQKEAKRREEHLAELVSALATHDRPSTFTDVTSSTLLTSPTQ